MFRREQRRRSISGIDALTKTNRSDLKNKPSTPTERIMRLSKSLMLATLTAALLASTSLGSASAAPTPFNAKTSMDSDVAQIDLVLAAVQQRPSIRAAAPRQVSRAPAQRQVSRPVQRSQQQVSRPAPKPQIRQAAPKPQPQIRQAAPKPQRQVSKVASKPQQQVSKVAPKLQPQISKAAPKPQQQVSKVVPKAPVQANKLALTPQTKTLASQQPVKSLQKFTPPMALKGPGAGTAAANKPLSYQSNLKSTFKSAHKQSPVIGAGRSILPNVKHNAHMLAGSKGFKSGYRPYWFSSGGSSWYRHYYTVAVAGVAYWYWTNLTVEEVYVNRVVLASTLGGDCGCEAPPPAPPACDCDDDDCGA
jgi:outer membrane biosynthesis protein TonB